MRWLKRLSSLEQFMLGITILILVALLSTCYADVPASVLKARYANEESKWLAYRGTSIHYRDEGSGPPLFLVHGTSASLHTWDGWTTELKGKYRVVRMDLPGFGLTGPRPDEVYTLDSYLEVVRTLAGHLGIDRFHLAGNSLGGLITWRFAVQYPHMVDKIILLNAGGYRPDGDPALILFGKLPIVKHGMQWITPRFVTDGQVENAYGDASRIASGVRDRYHDLLLREGNRRAFVDFIGQLNRGESEHLIKNTKAPALILWGELDRLIPARNAGRFETDIAGSKAIVYQGVGHIPMEEIPVRSAADADEFLKERCTHCGREVTQDADSGRTGSRSPAGRSTPTRSTRPTRSSSAANAGEPSPCFSTGVAGS